MNNPSKKFTHIKKNDLPRMVDVSDKSVNERKAVAMARIHLGHELAELLKKSGSTKKGPVLQTINPSQTNQLITQKIPQNFSRYR